MKNIALKSALDFGAASAGLAAAAVGLPAARGIIPPPTARGFIPPEAEKPRPFAGPLLGFVSVRSRLSPPPSLLFSPGGSDLAMLSARP